MIYFLRAILLHGPMVEEELIMSNADWTDFLGNSHCINTWTHTKVTHLHSSFSDHIPIVMELKNSGQQGERNLERPFRFEKMWCNEEEFPQIISAAWERMGDKPSISEVAEAIDQLGKDLKRLEQTCLWKYKCSIEGSIQQDGKAGCEGAHSREFSSITRLEKGCE